VKAEQLRPSLGEDPDQGRAEQASGDDQRDDETVGDDVEPVQFTTTVTFEDLGGKTRIVWRGEFPTGILYIEPDKDDFVTLLDLTAEPLNTLPLDRIRPSREALDEIMESLR